jgi:hypothetical protein
VDATGAGDTFAGAFLARRARGEGLEQAARYANAAAALSTTGYGAVAPIPREDAVTAFLAARLRPGIAVTLKLTGKPLTLIERWRLRYFGSAFATSDAADAA